MSEQETDAPSSMAGPSISRRAPRGAACLNCRRRKMRCDGARPICGQCTRTNRESDCEYTDGPGPSPTQILEDRIARLETKIHELEHPELVRPSVVLHNPVDTPDQPFSPTGSIASSSVSMFSGDASPVISPASIVRTSSGSPVHALPSDPVSEPSIELLDPSYLTGVPSVSFLHIPRFLQAIQQPDPDVRKAQVSPALLNAVYLWGIHLSGNNSLIHHEPAYLARVTTTLSSTLGHEPPYSMINTIQAEVLLAMYFFSISRFLEGRYHCSAAVALALSCGLNKIRSLTEPSSRNFAHLQQANLPPPHDSIEEGERVRAFWVVFLLDKSWTVALGSPSHMNGDIGAQIDTPWPLEMSQYEEGGMLLDLRSSRTVHTFLHGPAAHPVGDGISHLALHAKASALFERATCLASQWTPTMPDTTNFYGNFMALDSVIDQFTASLLPLEFVVDDDIARTSLVTYTFARAATIQLHSNFKEPNRIGESKDVAAAKAAVAALDTLNVSEWSFVDPILAILWTAVCRVLIGEILRLHSMETDSSSGADIAAAGSDLPRTQEVDMLRTMLQKVFAAMNTFRNASPVMGDQVAVVQREMEVAGL
ncbi:Chromatin structure-remodeling complex protein RSC30 [Grifola frondosa]|uniref:Chromatin structure-remodeling complex protein RSC30 n=1 Tax=Grifola frondosa TaxID=5627 RepID=A0A1C7LTS9_GRIFR|nr:Chromatin structure-remodeling complex protein RSC30 [Grifola frondosa]